MGAILLYLLIGSVAGILSGLLGIGGGIIVVPSLVWIFKHYHIAPHEYLHMAIGSSLASIIFISLAAAITHYRRQNILWPIFWRLLPSVIAGTMIGAVSIKYIPAHLLGLCLALFLFFVAFRMAFLQKQQSSRQLPGIIGLSGLGLLVGAQSALLGIGGGTYMIPFFSRCNVLMRHAAATSITVCVPLTFVGSVILSQHTLSHPVPWSCGYVYWPATLGVATTSLVFAPLGVHLAQHISNRKLKTAFSWVLVAVGCDLLLPNLIYYWNTFA